MRLILAPLVFAATMGFHDAKADTAGQRPVVVELFTSESCSSCPPADALLVDLARGHPDVLPLAFHVTYWDGPGWRDPFSLDLATDRQRQYATLLRNSEVYTPEIVVEGSQGMVGSNRGAVFGAIRAAASRLEPSVLHVSREGDGVRISVGSGGGAGTIWLIGYDEQHRTAVGGGENGGRSLLEANIVRSFRQIGRWQGSAFQTVGRLPSGERSAVIVQADDGRIVDAARVN